MKHLRYSVLCMFVMVLALVFIGCAKPPDAEKSAAQSALKAATAAGAEKYAAAPMEAGKILWEEAEKLLKAEQYDAAKAVYIAAKTAFDKAAKTAVTAKKTLTDEVTKTVAGLEEQWKGVEAAALAIEKKMKAQKEVWDADALLFAQELQATKGIIATDMEGAKVKAEELKAMIEKWDTTIKELEKAPEKPMKKGKK
jgi:hypothetical protein